MKSGKVYTMKYQSYNIYKEILNQVQDDIL